METTNTNPAPQPGTAEYNKVMATAGANVPVNWETVQNPTDARPAWLPEQFKTPEEFAAAYVELTRTAPPAKEPVKPAPAEPGKGFDFSEFNTEYATTGALSEASYAKLAGLGFNRDLVDTYIEGQVARASSYTDIAYQAVGGAESYNQLVAWAAANLNPQEVAAYNRQVGSSDPEILKWAVAGLQARYVAATGERPNLLSGVAGGVPGVGFRSRAEVTAAMSDPRYERDPAYREEVAQKIRAGGFPAR